MSRALADRSGRLETGQVLRAGRQSERRQAGGDGTDVTSTGG